MHPMRVLALCVTCAVLLCLAAMPRVERYFQIQSGIRADATLGLALAAMRGGLDRTSSLPRLIAERPILIDLLRDPTNSGLLPFANEQLRQTALALDVSDVYVMDRTGMTIAASSYRTEGSFVGRRFDYRPYFRNALQGAGNAQFHALGTTSGTRGYFYAAPLLDGTEIVGVVAVKTSVDRFETSWKGSQSQIIVVDSNDVIFMSSRPEWRFRTLSALPPETVHVIDATRQYPVAALRPLDLRQRALTDDLSLMQIDREPFVAGVGLVAAAGWRAFVLTPTGPARAQAQMVVAFGVLTLILIGILAGIVLQRRARMVDQIAAQAATQDALERAVLARTADLDAANTRLRAEVAERTATAQQLRKTQAELVQAGKLAALGQMSAALSHEFNQPLAAVKAYAENAAAFLDRGRVDEARGNIRHISGMADRMASISKHLRNFARRPQDQIGPIPLGPVIGDALELMRLPLDKSGTRVHYTPPCPEIWVQGGRVRLQQVIVNLISNALDAMETTADPQLHITCTPGPGPGDQIAVSVRDTGPGLADGADAQVFDPFFTTKSPGKGLGLGLSISYNIIRDFGGQLSVTAPPQGGAAFTVTLVRAAHSALATPQDAGPAATSRTRRPAPAPHKAK